MFVEQEKSTYLEAEEISIDDNPLIAQQLIQELQLNLMMARVTISKQEMLMEVQSTLDDEEAYHKEETYLLMQIDGDLSREGRMEMINMIKYAHPEAAARNDLDGVVQKALDMKKVKDARMVYNNYGTYVEETDSVTNHIGHLPDNNKKPEDKE